MTSCNTERLPEYSQTAEYVPVGELARRQGVKPITSIEDLFPSHAAPTSAASRLSR